MTATFEYEGGTYSVFDHSYNSTARNERGVEVPVALAFIERQPLHSRGLEVGNVLSHYVDTNHLVVDKFEVAPGVVNRDLFEMAGAHFDWIVSISTIEHVGQDSDPPDWDASVDAIPFLRSLLNPNGEMLVTVPLGCHKKLDASIAHGDFKPTRDVVMVRKNGSWEPKPRGTWRPYGVKTAWAEAVWVAEFEGPE